MKRVYLILLLALGTTMSGCALLDGLTGLREDPKTGEIIDDGSGGASRTLAPLVDSLLPGAGAALGLLGMLYTNIRKKKYIKAGKSMVPAIDMILNKLDKGESIDKEEVLSMLTEWKRRLDVEKEINELRGK